MCKPIAAVLYGIGARLLGVSSPSVNSRENAFGKLDLRDRSRKALNRVAGLTKNEALGELGGFG